MDRSTILPNLIRFVDNNNVNNKDNLLIFKLVVYSAIIVILLVMAFYIFVYKSNDYVQAFDGKYYYVHDYNNKKEAADVLATINADIYKLVKHLKSTYGKDHHIVQNILSRYNPDVIAEHIPYLGNDDVAYTTNKGQDLKVCLRTIHKDDNTLHPYNIIKFVVLHELAHIGTNVKKHPYEFWVVFKFILKEAVKIGIYHPVDYSKYPIMYCDDMYINYSPLFDDNIN